MGKTTFGNTRLSLGERKRGTRRRGTDFGHFWSFFVILGLLGGSSIIKRCLSKAQRSCVPATALEQKITATKSRNEHEHQSKIDGQKLIHEQATNYQKSTKKRSKNVQKSSKNPPKIDQNRGLEGVWSDSGSQVRLGTKLGWPRCDFRGQDGPNLAPKMEPKSIKIW